jgi:hypothetical protein
MERLPLPRFVDYSLRFIAPISLALAIYFHYQSVQERVPMFYVSPTRARIVDTSIPAPPQMQVLYKGKNLNANVSAATVYFWNDGKLPIKAEDVLEPLKIEVDPACEIIDARILKVSRAVTRFAKGEVSDTAKNVLPISFGILERNDGGAVQIIYSGRPDTTVSIAGTVVGANAPRPLAPDERSFEAEARKRNLTWQAKAGFIFTTLGAFIAGWWSEPWIQIARLIGAPTTPRPTRPRGTARLLTLLLCVALTAAGTVLERRAIHHLSPSVPESIWLKQ